MSYYPKYLDRADSVDSDQMLQSVVPDQYLYGLPPIQ